jgi:hypothetical protein
LRKNKGKKSGYTVKYKMPQVYKKVISASRRIDMVGNAPDQFVEILHQKCPPGSVHTLVIWTKNAENLFEYKPLFEAVQRYDQLFFHYTVTGMGGTILEPRVPRPDRGMSFLPKLVELVGDPRRIRFRFDPIVNLIMPDGSAYCNLSWFEKLAPQVKALGIQDISISWMSEYRKVLSRLKRSGITPMRVTPQLWQRQYTMIMETATKYNLIMHGCCVPGMPRSKCIDGNLLAELHPNKEPCSKRKAKGQRAECGCTESWDIGWYHHCYHGCRYCYANPGPIL